MHLVGRRDELQAIEAVLDAAARGEGRLLILEGQPGIGKTTLAVSAFERARARGFVAGVGRADEMVEGPPLWPWAEALRSLGIKLPLPTAPDVHALAIQTIEMFDAARGTAPLFLHLDDLHAADVASVDLLRVVARSLGPRPWAIIGTLRTAEARTSADIAALLLRVRRDATVLSLDPLSRHELDELDLARGASTETLDRVMARTEGVPLFAEELLRYLRSLPAVDLDVVMPDSIAAVLERRCAMISPAARALLGAAAVLGREVDAAWVGRVIGDGDVARALVEAERAELVARIAATRWRFSHVLIAESLASGIDPDEQRALHARAVEQLAMAGGGRVAIADHALRAGERVPATRVAELVRDATVELHARNAFAQVVGLVERALLRADLPPEARVELELVLGRDLSLAGHPQRARACFERVVDYARRAGDAERFASAVLGLGLDQPPAFVDARFVALVEEAVERAAGAAPGTRAVLLARLAAARQPAVDWQAPVQLASEAVALARESGDRAALAATLQWARAAQVDRVPPAERLALDVELADLAAGDDVLLLRARIRIVLVTLEGVDVVGAEAACQRAEEVARRLGALHHTWRARLARSMLLQLRGEEAAAQAVLVELRARFGAIDDLGFVPSFGHHAWTFAVRRRDQSELEQLGPMVAANAPIIAAAGWALVDDRERCKAVLGNRTSNEIMAANGGMPPSYLARLAAVLDDSDLARAAIPGLEARIDRAFVAPAIGFCYDGPFALDLARAYRVIGDDAGVHRALAVAERVARALGSARCLEQIELERSRSGRTVSGVLALVRDGEVWRLSWNGEHSTLKHQLGLEMLARLIAEPGRDLHVFELVPGAVVGDAGVHLDATAKANYRERLADVASALDVAEARGDLGRVGALREEHEVLLQELARAVGKGGQDRRAADASERARVNVQRRIKDALDKIRAVDRAAADHLQEAVSTGFFCKYRP